MDSKDSKKYKLGRKHPDRDLYRVVALRDIPQHNIHRGDIGGYIVTEENLSQEGDCWVYSNAEVYGNARVYGNTLIYGSAVVYGSAEVYDDARVHGNARVYGNARVHGNAHIYGDAEVYDNAYALDRARVYGNARVYGDARVSDRSVIYGDSKVDYKVIYLLMPQHDMTALRDSLQIGCKKHSYSYWLENYEEIGREEGYSEEEIDIYKTAIKMCRKWSRHGR